MKSRLPSPADQEALTAKQCLDRAPFEFYRFDRQGHLLSCNPKACQSLGYPMAELLEKTIFEINPNMTQADWRELWARPDTDRTVTFESVHLRQDGTAVPVEVTADWVEIDGSRLAILFAKEIAKRKRIEKELMLSRFSMDRAPIGIFRSAIGGQILDVNDKACEYLGYSREELCSMTVPDIDPTLSASTCSDLWAEMSDKGAIEVETMHRRKDGTTFPVSVTCNQFEYEGSRYSISIARDLTGMKKAEEQKELVDNRFRQAQRMESLGTLAGGIAHDFNNILSAIYGYAELAQLRCSAQSKIRQYIDQIYTESIRAKNLVKQIQTFSRQGESKKRHIDISIVIKETLKLIQATLPSTIEIRHRIDSGLGDVFADDTQVHQILMNLCTNAYHAMQTHGGLLEIKLERAIVGAYDSEGYPVITPGEYIKLTVSDTGEGIPPAILNRIFEPYFSTKPSAEGTGMGLSTVLGIVEDHGGSIKVSSMQGVGTAFQVFLPLAETTARQPAQKNRKPTVLVVDDEQPLLSVGKEFLEEMGYLVETTDNPIEAVKQIRLNPQKYDLIVTDLTMPRMTGDQLAREVKKAVPGIPIIMCTGFDAPVDLDQLTEMGISRLLMKPINLVELCDTIRKIL